MFNTNKVLLIMALPSESQGLFEKQGWNVRYCGIGKINAAAATARWVMEFHPTHVLNLGTAGSSKFSTHDLIECSAFVQRDMDITPLGFPLGETPLDPLPGRLEVPSLCKDLKKGVCGTGDAFEVGKTRLACDLVDMEAYAIAKVCRQMNVGMTSIKYISDGSDHNAHNDWAANLPAAAKALVQITQELLQKNNWSLIP